MGGHKGHPYILEIGMETNKGNKYYLCKYFDPNLSCFNS